MKRLLWKEWHEVRWYLLGLIVCPWVFALHINIENDKHYIDSTDLGMWALLLILGVWAATRTSSEGLEKNSLTTHSLPVKPGTVWAARFLPGLLAAVSVPFFVHVACKIHFHSILKGVDWTSIHGIPVPVPFIDNLMLCIAMYSVAFLVSMMASTMVAIIIGLGVVYPGCLFVEEYLNVTHGFSSLNQLYALLATMACFGSIGLSLRNPSDGLAVKLRTTGFSFIFGLATIFVLTSVVCIVVARSPSGMQGELRYLKSLVKSADVEETSDLWNISRPVTDYDGRRIAYNGVIKRGEKHHDMDVRVVDEHGDRSILRRKCASPLAWVQGHYLLIAASDSGRDVQLLRWHSRTGDVQILTTFEMSTSPSKSIPRVVPNSDGTFVAMLIMPVRGSYSDLWMFDSNTGLCRMVKPSIYSSWYDGFGYFEFARWLDGKFLYKGSDGGIWEINPDGTEFKRIISMEDLQR